MSEQETKVSAEVVLKSRSGQSLVNPGVPVTSTNIAQFTPLQETMDEAVHRLQQLGFTVAASSPTVTIVGTPEQFEAAFAIHLDVRPIGGRGIGWAAIHVQIGHSDLIHEIGRHGPFDFERMRPMEARQA